jgi:hypothetical protein
VLVRNTGTAPVTVQLATVDATTSQTGGSAFADMSAAPTAVATWLELNQTSVTLEPQTQQQVDFAVRAPARARPGQYLAGIAAILKETAPEAAPSQVSGRFSSSIVTQTRYVIGVEVDVPGAVHPNLTIANVKLLMNPSGNTIGVEMRNDGDTFLKPSGLLVLSDANGNQLLSQAIDMGTFVTGTAVTYPIRWPGTLAAGRYPVSVSLTYADDKQASYSGAIDVSSGTVASVAELQAAPQPAAADQTAGAPGGAGQLLRAFLIGISLTIAVALFGVYFYLRRQRSHAAPSGS